MNSLSLIFSNLRYLAPAVVFATINVLFGTWAIYIPAVKEKLKIDEGDLGIAIFFMALGTLTMLILAPKIIKKLKVGKATGYGVFGLIFVFPLLFMVSSYYWLCGAMFLVGVFSGFTDIAMNTLVTEIEKEDKVHIMSANHGFFSLGGMLSAGIGTFFLPYVSVPLFHVLVVAIIMILLNGFLLKQYYRVTSKEIEEVSFNIRYFIPLLGLILIGFCVMAAEGAIVDWSALYLEKVSKAKVSWTGFGYTAFSATMAFGRFLGDAISAKLGSKRIITLGTLLGGLGFALVLLVDPLITIIGFGLVGLGFSVIVPELFRIGGKTKNVESSQGISIIAGSGFVGFLVGPVLLGFLADISSLKLSFIALLIFSVVSFGTSLFIKK
ncbi:MFS transporter [Aquimarina sp. D1M17]|uniref:MFS transporter n=1 Tax=Aquimarina acroporae TaxID=2937283 RepID=UPI0020BEFCAE|nr:MFS transporter [Aquimarina acroporae]MCK8523928.1 MFS transporter [Aquimarina acroporae]